MIFAFVSMVQYCKDCQSQKYQVCLMTLSYLTGLVFTIGLIGCLTVTCIFIGFARLPVGDAATIIFCSPIFVMIFSHVVLREHCGLYRVFVIVLLILGVTLIAKPPFLVKLIFPNDNKQVWGRS